MVMVDLIGGYGDGGVGRGIGDGGVGRDCG